MAYLQDSLELNLFFLRILKEHALFLQLGFTPRDRAMAETAAELGRQLTDLLWQTTTLARGYISADVMNAGELFTRYTEEAERQTEYFTGQPMDIALTIEQYSMGGTATPPESLRPQIDALNAAALNLARQMAQFMQRILDDVAACRIETSLYPTQIDHLARELQHYIFRLSRLSEGENALTTEQIIAEQAFWNEIMGEHAEFIDGLLDPSEQGLKAQARAFAAEFARLTDRIEFTSHDLRLLPETTLRGETAARNIQSFKSQAAYGILSCKIRSIIAPLLSDHVLREASYYLRMLRKNRQF